ncbi:CMRF35-like molecule 7 [Brienomyrus brachyistius]|uniref:CMRF35-like molecule 7 n=1 Tax=Brienomyrus brachyistius TaxID=42636 RepID=UPI0020B2CFB8|nr:CMRF35-like molecule 7 [Brienomyrus brachyistius]
MTVSTENGQSTGSQKVLPDKHLTVMTGESVIFSFKYKSIYKDKVKFCCKMMWIVCKYVVRSDMKNPGWKILITDNQSLQVFTVTMKMLWMKDSGTYWCGVRRVPQGAYWYIQQ